MLLSLIFLLLQNGIFIQEAKFSTLSFNGLYIKIDEKIEISIKNITIFDSNETKKTAINYKNIQSYLKSISHTTEWFQSITVENLTYKDINASFHFKEGKDSFFIANSNDINISSSIFLNENSIHLKINHFTDRTRDISIRGNLYFNAKEIAIYSKLNFNIANEAKLTLFSFADTKKLFYKIKSHTDLKKFQHIIQLANLPKAVNFWVYDAIDMSSISIESFYGFLKYDKMDEAIKNVHIKIDIKNLNYTYNLNLDAIHTKHTLLEFKEGILYIFPKEAYSYGNFLGKSWIKIDFTKKEELLTLHLLFNAMLNKDILKILEAYKIKLPFLQKSGIVNTDLTIEIGLRNIDIDAKGTFTTKKANFDYLGLNIDIFDAVIKVDNYDVSIKNMYAKYQDIAKVYVDLNYNAKHSKGKILFRVEDIALAGVTNVKIEDPLTAVYNITPNGDFIDIAESEWQYKGELIKIDDVRISLDLNKFLLTIPATFVTLPNITTAFVSGSVHLKTLLSNLKLDILTFHYDGVEFTQSNTPINIQYIDNKMIFSSDDTIHFSLTGSKYKINNLYAILEDKEVSLKHTEIEIGKYITTKIYAKYNIKTKKSHVSLSKFILKDPNSNKILYTKKKILIGITNSDNSIKLDSKEIGASFSAQDTGWCLKINSLNRIVNNSPFLKKFHISKGNFTLYKNKNDKYTRFKSNIVYPFKILVSNGIPVDNYSLKGKIYKEKVYVTLNDTLNIEVKDTIDVALNHSVVNIFEAIRMSQNIENTATQSKPLDISLTTKESYIYVDEHRKILYDALTLKFQNKVFLANLEYKGAQAGVKLKDKKFNLFGKNFNDKFMNELFSLSKFNSGSLDFAIEGSLNNYKGVLYINKTNIKEYKMLNNILAFVNTVPSLITFSVPGYSNKGLFIDNAYLKFSAQNNIFNLSDIYLHSKEIDILGKGSVDFNTDKMDITLNLKTDLGSSLSQVPVVGYLILDGDRLSTTLSIKGDISNPEIKSDIAKEVIVAPLNIIKRTLSLPFKLIKDAIDDNKSK